MLDIIWNTVVLSTALVFVMIFGDIFVNGNKPAPDYYKIIGGLVIFVAITSWVLFIIGSLLV